MLNKMKHYGSYLVFGVLTTVVNLTIYKLLLDAGVHYTISTTVAFVVAVSVAFYTNRKWVFSSEVVGKKVYKEMGLFFAVRIGTYLFDLIGLILLIQFFSMDEFISKLIVNAGVIVLNYILSKWVVFKEPSHGDVSLVTSDGKLEEN
ncbi:Putative flippase GtrA (transmembrane translocase of bactoprenol-linked glucose) [Natronincola peptidivorans]|uniref:Putative flippase GtrA (Transmembrane translocase of bactoprenol-linked glucose) n=1 Tax=Natronincola peptidivorans TaxID=426128 RepID=A0A1H9ZIH4_9FIRM|nr:GtrA family protein [Natronincola peptidivorans]SES81502.1 Putative flippase GtrA (transmembrane translocase of bactoprenol-linked glucose) [Natronincola peptidivorans]